MTQIASEKVKMVDIHPKEPIFITACYSGCVNMYNYQTHALIKSFDTGKGVPTRCARFIPRLQSFVCGSDDKHIRVFNYNTMERTHMFRAHDDYIRSIAVHDQLPLVLTCADNGSIRQWDWSDNWALKCSYEAHDTYCMDIAFNPTNSSSFASGSLDCTICVWTINNPEPNFELLGHEEGVTCLQYYPRGDKPYLLSGSDDLTARLWDYQTKACLHVFTFPETATSVTSVLFSPDLPLIFVLTQTGFLNKISLDTFNILDTGLHVPSLSTPDGAANGWSLASKARTNVLIAGYDTGITIFQLGETKPIYSMDVNGKAIIVDGNDLQRVDMKSIGADIGDGEHVPVTLRDVGSVETRPSSISHNGNGQFICTLTPQDYTIISSLSLRQKAYGKCNAFVWGPDNNSYATLEGPMTVVLYQGFKKRASIALLEPADKLFTGSLLAVRSNTSTYFYDWDSLALILRQIDEKAEHIKWCPTGELVALATSSSIYILKYNHAEVQEFLHSVAEGTSELPVEGLDFAFDVADEVEDAAEELLWVGDCLVFSNKNHRLHYYIGGETNSLAILHPNEYLLGYLPKTNRIFCIDRDKNITSYLLQYDVISYMAAIVREDFEEAETLLQQIPKSSHYKLAQFLQSRGLLDMAIALTTEDQHRFSLAIELKQLDLARQIALSTGSSAQKWKQVADLALQEGEMDLAIEGYKKSGDLNSVLLILSSMRDMNGISALADEALAAGKANIAFTCLQLAQRHEECVQLLLLTGKHAEAAFYARTYCPEHMEIAVSSWKENPGVTSQVREAIANPKSFPNLFPMLKVPEKVSPPPAAPPSAPASEPPHSNEMSNHVGSAADDVEEDQEIQ